MSDGEGNAAYDLTPHPPQRPLFWPDAVLDLQDRLPQASQGDADFAVYIVGGAVRDAWMHRPIQDLDLVVTTGAIKFARQLANRLVADVFVLDEERDVARVIQHLPATVEHPEGERLVIDVAAFRGADLLTDLLERDFTLNAMAVDFKADLNLLIDPLGGEQDLKERRIRRCSPDAIAHDVIRGLRAIRQSVQFSFKIDAVTLDDLRVQAVLLKTTSGERIRDEFIKMLALPRPSAALRVMDHLGQLAVIIPEIASLHQQRLPENPILMSRWDHTLLVIDKMTTLLSAISFARTDNTASTFEMGTVVMQFDRYRQALNQHLTSTWANDRPHRAVLMLATLLHDAGSADGMNDPEASAKLAEQYADELRLSYAEKQRLMMVIYHHRHAVFSQPVTPLSAHRFWYRLQAAGIDVVLLHLADALGNQGHALDQAAWLVLVERVVMLMDTYFLHYDETVAPPPLVDGNTLKQVLDLKPGPLIGELLTVIREGQVEGLIRTVDEAVAAAQRYVDEQG